MDPQELELAKRRLAIETKLKRREQHLAVRQFQFQLTQQKPEGWKILWTPTGAVLLTAAIGLLGTAAGKWADYNTVRRQQETNIILKASDVPVTLSPKEQTAQRAANILWFANRGYVSLKKDDITELTAAAGLAADQAPVIQSSAVTQVQPRNDSGRKLKLNFVPSSRPKGVPVGVSIHIGANRTDPTVNNGFTIDLPGVIPDATAMGDLAGSLGYSSNVLLDADARSTYLLPWLDSLSTLLEPSDQLLITMAGTGGQKPSKLNSEPDGLEESWLLYDKEVPASEVYRAFAQFKAGVTIIVVQDCCNCSLFRRPDGAKDLAANLIVIAGAKEDQVAMEDSTPGDPHGAFSKCLLKVWNNDEFSGNYQELVEAVARLSKPEQQPQLVIYSKDKALIQRQPFKIK